MDQEKITQMQTMAARLNEASAAYYSGKSEIMTDFEWDALFDALRRLETETGVVLPESPTARVSEEPLAGRKEAHETPMLSLAKTKLPGDLVRFAQGLPIYVSWKLDGLTLVATYDGGRLSRVVTRGNGHVGTVITHLAPAIRGIPETIGDTGHLVVRGEAVISWADFEAFLSESGEEYANPRNLASGSLTLKDVSEVRRRRIRWVPFTLVSTERDLPDFGDRMDYLASLGFEPVERERVDTPDEAHVQSVIDAWTRRVTDGENPWPVDGLVITYADTVYASTGSVTGHHANRAGLAFKWQDESAETALERIEWSCAAGSITPVAVFSPVELEGTTVKRASLCNISECERLGIGGKGTRLSVIKANKIIPKVVRVEETVGNLDIPDRCPVCGEKTEIRESAPGGTRTLRCLNDHCPAKRVRVFTRFVSREGVNIDGLSAQTVALLINLGWVREYADFFTLKAHETEMKALDGFGEKSVSNLLAAVENARHVTAPRLLYALGIPLCGQDVARRLLRTWPLADLVRMAKETDDPEIFSDADGIGPEKSASFVRWFQSAENAEAFSRLMEQVTVEEQNEAAGQKCAGLTFVVTGDVHIFANRNALKQYIESEGGKVTGAVSKATDFLINNNPASTSAKNKKAKELNIPILTEEEFTARYGAE